MGRKHQFLITFEGQATIELDSVVLDAVDDEWRANLYNLQSPLDIAKHIAYNLVLNNLRLEQLDGWADQPNENARLLGQDWELTAKAI